MIGPVAKRLQILRKEASRVRSIARRHDIARGLLRVLAGEQAGPRRPAARGGISLSEAESLGREPVEIRRIDVAAVTSGVGEAHVVGENDQEVRLPCGGSGE